MGDRTVRLVLTGDSRRALAALEEVGLKAEVEGHRAEVAFGDRIQAAAKKSSGALGGLSSAMGSFGIPFAGSVDKIGEKIGTAQTKGQKFGTALSEAGKVATLGIIAGGVAVGVESLRMAGNFQQAMSKLVTSGGEAASNLKSDMSGVEKLMGETGTSAAQLAAGLYTINSAGFHGAAGLTVLKAAAEGAKTENADVAVVTDGLTTLLNDYNLKASDAALVTSKMVAATSLGKTTFQDLAGSLHTVSPAANAAGISMNEVLGAMATMTAKGTPAADAATYLRQTILQLSNPSKKARGEMSSLGLSFIDVSQNLGKRGLTGTLELLTSAIQSKMGPAGTVLIDNLKQAAAAGSGWAQKLQEMTPAQQAQIKSLADMGYQVDQIKTKIADGSKATAADKQVMAEYQAKLAGMPSSFRSVLDGLIANKLGYTDLASTVAKLPPEQQTVIGALADMVGGTKSMQAALELTGGSADTFQANVAKVAKATTDAGGHVAGWSTVQGNLNQQLAEAKQTAEALGVKFGMFLIPKVETLAKDTEAVVGWFEKHKEVAEALAAVVGGALSVAVGAFAVNKIAGLVKGVQDAVKVIDKLASSATNAAATLLQKFGVIGDSARGATGQVGGLGAAVQTTGDKAAGAAGPLTAMAGEESAAGAAAGDAAPKVAGLGGASDTTATKVSGMTAGAAGIGTWATALAGAALAVGAFVKITDALSPDTMKKIRDLAGALTPGTDQFNPNSVGTPSNPSGGQRMFAPASGHGKVAGTSTFSQGQQTINGRVMYPVPGYPGDFYDPNMADSPIYDRSGQLVPLRLDAKSGQMIPARARGGPVHPGQPYLVGEEGPELFMPSTAGTIMPNRRAGATAGLSAGGPGQVNLTVYTNETDPQALMNEIKFELRPYLASAGF